MHPPAEDNYGLDACSILCLHSSPVILVVATSSGILHHCVVLTGGNDDDDDDGNDNNVRFDLLLYLWQNSVGLFHKLTAPQSTSFEQNKYLLPKQFFSELSIIS